MNLRLFFSNSNYETSHVFDVSDTLNSSRLQCTYSLDPHLSFSCLVIICCRFWRCARNVTTTSTTTASRAPSPKCMSTLSQLARYFVRHVLLLPVHVEHRSYVPPFWKTFRQDVISASHLLFESGAHRARKVFDLCSFTYFLIFEQTIARRSKFCFEFECTLSSRYKCQHVVCKCSSPHESDTSREWRCKWAAKKEISEYIIVEKKIISFWFWI